ncbi:MAG: TonB-dependent receptor domain-containing protein, partial [Caulobacteraceae bacterium]
SEKTHLASMPLTINVGLREEVTRVSSAGLGEEPTALTVQTGDVTSFQTTFGPTQAVRTQSTYSYLLPNLDLGLSVTDQLKVRMDISRTLSRPPISDLTPVTVVPTSPRVGQLTATGGNPTLLPYLSDNFDLGAEWYYQKNSYISLDGYIKHVTNFIVAGSTQESINGVIDPTTGKAAEFTVSTNVNGPQADVYGMEFALQHVFWDTGFGFQFNTTVVGTNKNYDPNNLSISGFAVTGLADSSNIVGFYDKHGFQARVAVNWRDSYLDHFGQQQNGSLFGTEPTFVNSNTTVDFSTSYDVTKQLSVYFEALNLSDSGYSTRGRFSNQFLDIVSYGRRFTLGAHFRY